MEKDLIENKIKSLVVLLEKLTSIIKEYEKNEDLKEFLLYAAEKKAEEIVELAISINQKLLNEKKIICISYYDSFMDLKSFNIFKMEELKELAGTAGFRNRLAHNYLEIDEAIAIRSMRKILTIYPFYLQKVKKIIEK